MTPSDTTAKRPTARPPRDDDLGELILACGRDERPALQALYRQTAGHLYGLALAAAPDRATANRALVQAYLEVFDVASTFEGGAERQTAIAWLIVRLARQLPGLAKLGTADAVKPVEPPTELWQKLDIGLGLKRLDRHIKPGVATQLRGRDPMPNAYDRRIERQLRFWRSASVGCFLGFAAAMSAILALGLQGGPAGLMTLTPADPTQSPIASVEPMTEGILASAPTGSTNPAEWHVVMQPAEGNRLWHVRHSAGIIEVSAMPPFTLSEPGRDATGGARVKVLALWASASDGLLHLGTLDPSSVTRVALPAGLDVPSLAFAVSLEPDEGAADDGPHGPLLFAGGRSP